MTASAIVTVMCDAPSCGDWSEDGQAGTAKDARRGLRGLGWRLAVPNPNGGPAADFCPRHATARVPLDFSSRTVGGA